MPIEIRELVIKATVSQDSAGAATGESVASANSVSSNENIINACVEKIIEILKDKYER